ncbi:hypothetical protein [Mycobacteroides salmoniphilum]|uniref:hypothetical protein n=1 Tax=Mycobacteroides salmoniphilum TaxID=404941 RepID=UPI0009934571|nr:hypothetical protein [Mycobacteroides salmoniphilum]
MRWTSLATVAAVVLLSAAGCRTAEKPVSTPTPAAQFPNWPAALNDFRFRWSAEPGIDLLNGPAVPLRAYLESHRIGDYTQDLQAVYPGFDQAVAKGPKNPEFIGTVDSQLDYIRPFTNPLYGFGPFSRDAGPFTFRGNEYLHILEMTPIETGYRAYVCDGLYKVFHPTASKDGRYESAATGGLGYSKIDPPGVRVWRVEFTDKSTQATSLPEQRGPNPAPLGNVFGHWFITGANFDGYWGDRGRPETKGSDTTHRDLVQRCADRMPDDAEQRGKFYTGEHENLPPLEPAEPGWPSNPV